MVEARPPVGGNFWASSGFALLDRDAGGYLRLSGDLLRAYLARPEMLPTAQSCDAEVALHHALLAEPCQPVGAAWLAALADADVRDNYRHWLRFRDRLLASP